MPTLRQVIICGPKVAGMSQCACGVLAGYLCDYPIGDGKTCDRAG